MQAMVLEQNAPIESHPLALRELPDPHPADNQALVRVTCCAICRTDLHVIEGDLPPLKFPLVPGHQVVGVVEAVGNDCRRLNVGDRVGIAWLRHTCGQCRFCTSGRENLCPFSQYTGYHANGGYATLAVAPEDFIYDIPPQFTDAEAAPLLCAGIIGYRALKRCNLPAGGRLGLFGFGSSAHIVLQLAVRRGASVYVVSRSESHQRLARELGATWAGADIMHMPEKLDSAIVFAPSGQVVPAALQSLDRGGVVSLAGIHMTPLPPMDYDRLLFNERDIHPVTANTRADATELLAEAAAAQVRPHIRRYPLAEANRALLDMKHGRIDGTGVLVTQPPPDPPPSSLPEAEPSQTNPPAA